MFTFSSGLYALLAGTAHLGLSIYLLVQGERGSHRLLWVLGLGAGGRF